MSYLLPAEWESQSAVMLTWPHQESIWADTLNEIDQVFTTVAYEISKRQKLIITCFNEAHQAHILALLQAKGAIVDRIACYLAPSNDIWVRDHGPITVVNNERLQLLDFSFNGWGNKYPAEDDNCLTRALHAKQAFGAVPLKTIDMVLEGGAIEVDGEGTLLTTKSALHSSSRNPNLNESAMYEQLKCLLGIKKILCLEQGYLAGDDTDGHIDTLARFANAQTIIYTACSLPDDEHYAALKTMEEELHQFKDQEGRPYHLIALPWPEARYAKYDGRRLPVTYANFLLINSAVLVPTYQDPADEQALDIFRQCFKGREVIGINCLPVVEWYGSLHCMTMQLPKGVVL
jgi:agmatine deiminase